MGMDNLTTRLFYICSLTVIFGGIRVQDRFVDAYYLCYHAPGTWRQAVDNCSKHEGKLVSVPVINQTLSVRDAIRLLYNLNMTVWKDVWIGNFVSAEDIQIATTGNSHISSQSHLCGTVTIEHYDDQKAFTSLPKYVNCSIDHPPICGYRESIAISSSPMDWNTAHNTCGRDGLYTFSSTATQLGIRCGTVNTSLSYWVNSVRKLQWNDIQTTSDTPNPHSCGSLQYKPKLTALSPCDEVKPFVCRVDYVKASDIATNCVFKTESNSPGAETGSSHSPKKTTPPTDPPEIKTSSAHSTKKIPPPSAKTIDHDSNHSTIDAVSHTTTEAATMMSASQNKSRTGVYIGASVGVICVVCIVLVFVVVVRKRRLLSNHHKRRSAEYEDCSGHMGKQSNGQTQHNIAYDPHHGICGQGHVFNVSEDHYAEPFDGMSQGHSFENKDGLEMTQSCSYAVVDRTRKRNNFELTGHYDRVADGGSDIQSEKAHPNTADSNYDRLGETSLPKIKDKGSVGNIYNTLGNDTEEDDNEYGIPVTQGYKWDLTYDHVTAIDESPYDRRGTPKSNTSDPTYDHTLSHTF